ncbi:hypothetical protein DEO72_LG8g1665 [Vigna unguiculata]|uniref:Uncharacterized protein n=1 Tax=Vigna unguiculata TaxID=3917 RepID=A0A4D6MQ13_VIGUN|nr:hypothetical protein DEO72_LG8g1665 [Vigna unguiculata]
MKGILVQFENRLSHVRSEQGSCVGGSQQNTIDDPAADDMIKTKYWVEVFGGKNKGRIYGTEQLARRCCCNYVSVAVAANVVETLLRRHERGADVLLLTMAFEQARSWLNQWLLFRYLGAAMFRGLCAREGEDGHRKLQVPLHYFSDFTALKMKLRIV